jgi:uncharacterized membrane protein YgaE (UPF0421/DUF939 family)
MFKSKTIIVTLQNIVIVIGAFICGFYFTKSIHEPTSYVGGLWSVISGIIVIESTHTETWHSSKNRILGTLIGAIVSGVYLYLFDFSLLGYAVSIAIGIMVCYVFKAQASIKLTGITISVILIVSTIESELHPFMNAGLRFVESAIGTGIALLTAIITYRLEKAISRKKKP